MRYLSVKVLETLTNELRIATVNEANFEVQTLTIISKKPSLLIGSDYFWDVLLFDEFYVKTLSNGYRLIHSSLGDIVTGQPLKSNVDYCYNSFAMSNKSLEELVNRFWELESEGIFEVPEHSDHDECIRKFNETTYFDKKEGRYIVQLPFKGKQEDLPNNIQLAYARLKQNVKSLRLRPGMVEKYHIIQEQLAHGIIEEVQEKQLPLRCHYLPHHAVLTEEKLTISTGTVWISCVTILARRNYTLPSANVRNFSDTIDPQEHIRRQYLLRSGQFYQQSKELFQQAGMNLRQYVSNSTKLNQFLSEQENSDVSTNNKILGTFWNISEDSLCIKLPTVFTDDTGRSERF